MIRQCPTNYRTAIERLVARRLFAVSVDGTAGADVIMVARVDNAVVVRINGAESTVAADSTSSGLVINAGGGDDTIRFDGVGGSVASTVNGEAGNDRITIGDGDVVGDLTADVIVHGGAGDDAVTLDDSLRAATDTLQIENPTNTFLTVARGTSPGLVMIDIGSAATAIEAVTVRAGSAGDAINVTGTSAIATLSIYAGDGDDVLRFGDDLDSRMLGAIAFDAGGGGGDALLIDDSADSFGDTYAFAGSAGLGTVAKNSGGATLSYTNVEALTLCAGVGGGFVPNNQLFRITHLPANTATTIVAGSGDDVLRVGDGIVDLSAIGGPITFYGEDDLDTIEYIDTVGTDPASYTVYPSSLDVSGNASIRFDALEALNVRANAGVNFMQVLGTTNFMNVTVNGGGGGDFILVGNGDLDADLANSVSVVGGAGNDALFLNDSIDDVGNDTYTFTAGVLNRAQRAVLWSTSAADAVEFIQLSGSPNADTIRVNDVAPTGGPIRIEAGGGNDAIFVARTNGGVANAPPVTILSGAGDDTLDVNSDFAGADAFVELSDANEDLVALDIRNGGRASVSPQIVDASQRVLTVRTRLSVNGLLDVNDQTLIVRAAAATFASVNALGANGYNNGTWMRTSGAGILSTVSGGSTLLDGLAVVTAGSINTPIYDTHTTAAGDTIVRYTLVGDADVDRDVDFDDLLILARNYDPNVGGRTWVQGNFNYAALDPISGATGFDDLLLLAKNYGAAITPTPLAAALTAAPTRAKP